MINVCLDKAARALAVMALLACCAPSVYGQSPSSNRTESVSFRFAAGAWKTSEWILVKSPRWKHFGGWEQKADHIQNQVPSGATEEQMLGKLAPETYTSMVYARMVSTQFTLRATMAFMHRMAPLIVLAPVLGRSADGCPEYREHFEIVIFDKGVNVWRHAVDVRGKPVWTRAAYGLFPLKPGVTYRLEVVKIGKNLQVSVDGHTLGYHDEALPESCYVGITGCEGLNKFYDFSIEP
ncbi:MAG: hypothetical protein KJ964_00760 [Verrucomicrobia bacterium]|nr:hypothetical protein [Verrucomicrobiota bacterium]MBU1736444.1 hypothetical protein [Verrucomicrobiota bacterium]MBU1856178.1 hypothetical protein [Verrucomicrobiota bacterium]